MDFMAVGRPIMSPAAGEAEQIVRGAASGIVVAPEDPQALADGARWLREHPDDARSMGERVVSMRASVSARPRPSGSKRYSTTSSVADWSSG